MPVSEQEKARFRSFAERYVIERAQGFPVGHELEHAWAAIEDAKKMYGMIEQASSLLSVETPQQQPISVGCGIPYIRSYYIRSPGRS
jgi:hypothetical protein